MEYRILSRIASNDDVKKLSVSELDELAAEIRAYLLETVSKTGGHLASNLGAVELTIALNYVFSTPEDSIIYDVGHQSYSHKIINGRRDLMSTLRTKDGISGFPKRSESVHDSFNTGHASTSVSAAVGIMRAKLLSGTPGRAVAVIGDGALGGGMVFEALNDAGQTRTPVIIVLNDNGMSISKNTGALSRRLSLLRSSKGYISFKTSTKSLLARMPVVGTKLRRGLDRFKDRVKFFLLPATLFEELEVTYLGPVDGHDIGKMITVLSNAKHIDKPVLIHVTTRKGKGYVPAEEMPEKFHGVSANDMADNCAEYCCKPTNSRIFGETLTELAESDARIVAITAAMTAGTGLTCFAKRFPKRFFDVGIAEQHAVTMAAGLAAGGMLPVVAIYSTFLQRAYDQLLHDVCLQGLHVVFAVDRAGLVGEDGETHQGAYDIAYLSSLPNMTVLSPSTADELKAMLKTATKLDGPVAIRYSRGLLPDVITDISEPGAWVETLDVRKYIVIATGRMVEEVRGVCAELGVGLVNARCIKPLDDIMLQTVAETAEKVAVIEDGIAFEGLGSAVAVWLSKRCIPVDIIGLPNLPLPQATAREQSEMCGMLPEQIRARLSDFFGICHE